MQGIGITERAVVTRVSWIAPVLIPKGDSIDLIASMIDIYRRDRRRGRKRA